MAFYLELQQPFFQTSWMRPRSLRNTTETFRSSLVQLLLIRKFTQDQLKNCLSWSLKLKIPFNAEFTLLFVSNVCVCSVWQKFTLFFFRFFRFCQIVITWLWCHERPLVPLPGLGQQPLSEVVSLYNATFQTLQKVQRILGHRWWRCDRSFPPLVGNKHCINNVVRWNN